MKLLELNENRFHILCKRSTNPNPHSSPSFNDWLKGLGLPDGVQERIDKLGWACNKTLDIETLITQFQRFYNTFAIVFTLVLTIYSAMASTKARFRHGQT